MVTGLDAPGLEGRADRPGLVVQLGPGDEIAVVPRHRGADEADAGRASPRHAPAGLTMGVGEDMW